MPIGCFLFSAMSLFILIHFSCLLPNVSLSAGHDYVNVHSPVRISPKKRKYDFISIIVKIIVQWKAIGNIFSISP